MLNPKTNVGKLRNGLICIFSKWPPKIMEFDITEIFYFLTMFLHPKSFVLSPQIVLPLEYMVLVAIYIIVPGYYRIHGNKCRLSL